MTPSLTVICPPNAPPRCPGRGELDQLTLARARKGDRQALGQLVDWYGQRVYALVSLVSRHGCPK